MQAVKKPHIMWGEVTLMEVLPSEENKAEADNTLQEESAMGNIFSEIQLLSETGPNSELIQVS